MNLESTIIGTVISFISSIEILIVERLFEKHGKLKIYAKRPSDRLLHLENSKSRFLLMVSFGTAKTGKAGKQNSNPTESID